MAFFIVAPTYSAASPINNVPFIGRILGVLALFGFFVIATAFYTTGKMRVIDDTYSLISAFRTQADQGVELGATKLAPPAASARTITALKMRGLGGATRKPDVQAEAAWAEF